jgi:hypothetical protein
MTPEDTFTRLPDSEEGAGLAISAVLRVSEALASAAKAGGGASVAGAGEDAWARLNGMAAEFLDGGLPVPPEWLLVVPCEAFVG